MNDYGISMITDRYILYHQHYRKDKRDNAAITEV
jgi:hypothetical protein